jgi:signal transduction histidine kinase
MNIKSPIVLLLLFAAFIPLIKAHPSSHEKKIFTMQNMEEGILLNGDWDFYWKTTFKQHKIQPKEGEKLYVPGDWLMNNHEAFGYGLYMREVIIPDAKGKVLSLIVPAVCNNYNFYINDSLFARVGNFSTTGTDAVAEYSPRVVTFRSTSDTIEFAFEISNYVYREGGLNYEILLGTKAKVRKIFETKLIWQGFFTGALFIISIYFFCIFVIRTKEKVSLYFALLCFTCATRIFFTDMVLWRQLEIPLPWEYLVKFELMSIMLVPTFGMLYLLSMVEEKKYRWIMHVCNALTALLCLFIFFSSTYWASFTVPPFRYFATFELVFLLLTMLRATFVTKHRLGPIIALAFLFVFVMGMNDILHSANIINTLYALPITIFVYVLMQAVILAKRWTNTLVEVENLSEQLSQVNKNQEAIIVERTSELNAKTVELGHYNDIKDRIFSIIGHDLRAPISTLSSVLSLAEQADNERELEELRTYFKGIKISVDNLNLTIENLLVWSQSQINGVKLNVTNVNVNREIENAIALYSLVAMRKDITLAHTLEDNFMAKVDAAHLNLILRNIISNSLKFTNKGGTITVSASMLNSHRMQISIKDNGIGLQSEKINQILNASGTHYTTYGTQNEKGTGLGLMLCKEYIEANGGDINIESALGVGTIVTINLPRP